MSWWMVGSIVLNTLLAILFITGGFFMTRRYLRKMREANESNATRPNK